MAGIADLIASPTASQYAPMQMPITSAQQLATDPFSGLNTIAQNIANQTAQTRYLEALSGINKQRAELYSATEQDKNLTDLLKTITANLPSVESAATGGNILGRAGINVSPEQAQMMASSRQLSTQGTEADILSKVLTSMAGARQHGLEVTPAGQGTMPTPDIINKLIGLTSIPSEAEAKSSNKFMEEIATALALNKMQTAEVGGGIRTTSTLNPDIDVRALMQGPQALLQSLMKQVPVKEVPNATAPATGGYIPKPKAPEKAIDMKAVQDELLDYQPALTPQKASEFQNIIDKDNVGFMLGKNYSDEASAKVANEVRNTLSISTPEQTNTVQSALKMLAEKRVAINNLTTKYDAQTNTIEFNMESTAPNGEKFKEKFILDSKGNAIR